MLGLAMQDQKTMVVVADTSGSMGEHGKALLVRNLIAYVRETFRLSVEPSLLGNCTVLLWNEQITVVEPAPEEDLPHFEVGGRAQMQPLLVALEQIRAVAGEMRVLLVSDGHFSGSDHSAFKAWQRRHPAVSVRTLAVGPDAVHTVLRKLAEPCGAFAAEDVSCAIGTWTLPREPTLPTFLTDLIHDAAGGPP